MLPFLCISMTMCSACYPLYISFKVLPLENEMRNPEDFGWVLNLGMGIVTTLFLTVGIFGFLTFGYGLEGSVTLNLPDHW